MLIGLAALVVVALPFLWPLAEHFNAIAHEGAHAAVGSVMGFGIKSVTLSMEPSGVTDYYRAPNTGVRRTLTRFVGYLGPSGFGLCAAKLIETGHAVTVLWVAIMLLVLLLFVVRKSFAMISVPGAIVLLALVMRNTHSGVEDGIIYGMTWLLLLSGVRVAVAHGGRRKSPQDYSHSRPDLGTAVDGGHDLGCRRRGEWLVLQS